MQSGILTAIRTADPRNRPSNTRVADVLGCDRSEVSRFEGGSRRLDLDELVGAIEEWGPTPVLGVIAARYGHRVVPDPEAAADEGPRAPAAAELGAQVASLTVAVLMAESDGKLDDRERASLARDLDAIAQRVAALRSGLGKVA